MIAPHCGVAVQSMSFVQVVGLAPQVRGDATADDNQSGVLIIRIPRARSWSEIIRSRQDAAGPRGMSKDASGVRRRRPSRPGEFVPEDEHDASSGGMSYCARTLLRTENER